MSLRSQVNLRIVLTSLFILVLGGSVAVWQARGAVSKEIESSLNLAAQLIQLNFPQARQSAVDVSAWLPRFVSLEQTRHLQIHLKKTSGEIVKFTAGLKRADAADTPPQWFVGLVAADYPSIEQQLITSDGQRITLLIQADPLDEISEAWKESSAYFMSLCVMAALTFLAVNLVFNKAFQAIAVIVDGLKAIGQGQYQQKLPDFGIQEYDHIAKAINYMTAVLDATQQENSALTLHSLQIQEEERQYLSQELHDELGQSLTAIKVMAVTAKKPQADTGQITDAIITICDHLIVVVRSMMRQLHPLVLAELGLKATLEDLLNHWASRQPELALTLLCSDEVDQLEPKMTIQLFRVVQEAITNIVRHAKASDASIRLDIDNGKHLLLEITDNGQGCTPGHINAGFGLRGMRERINSLGGNFTIHAAPQQGLRISASIPLP
ncbi:MAG: histidine kinase [Methylovulum sp.]|uniref:ATP-binding protein n=1 Tax=Methylovulum sp. TaxID=1916980 RepID=UPI00262E36AB|nr:ATP-binding protein [Methylovulum sp.]MDD2722595.1 histidine kinase [Methylovulum sp.]MDD5123807.1 histidine kinase [Methylovulum sp.]